MQKLRALLHGGGGHSSPNTVNGNGNGNATGATKRQSEILEPEIGFQITIEPQNHQNPANDLNAASPELSVNLLAARHLPTLFGFKIVQGYVVKVKLFPGSKRLESSIQTNTWPKFNETFRFPLTPEIRSSLRHSARQTARDSSKPEELFSGQFVVFTVYALLELPPASFNRLNKTYRSLRDKSSSLVQKVIETSGAAEKTSDRTEGTNGSGAEKPPTRPKTLRDHPMPALTISEARRNIGSVTCYLEPKLFKRNPRTGLYSTNELWSPIKDITTTAARPQSYNGRANNNLNNNNLNNNNSNSNDSNNNHLTNAAKGVVEITLEMRECGDSLPATPPSTPTSPTTNGSNGTEWPTTPTTSNKWRSRMTAEVKRKIGLSNTTPNCSLTGERLPLLLRVTTSRMRCSPKAKDELECTAGTGVYVKTTVFEHDIYVDAWKSSTFYPSLATKWDLDEKVATLEIPLRCIEQLDNICVRTTLATKTKLGKKLVLGTVVVGLEAAPKGSGAEHMRALRETPLNEKVAMWHSYR